MYLYVSDLTRGTGVVFQPWYTEYSSCFEQSNTFQRESLVRARQVTKLRASWTQRNKIYKATVCDFFRAEFIS